MKTLNKVSCQGSHFVFRFFRIGTASPASSPSSNPTPGVPHSCMFKLYQILEDWITENTACVLSFTSRKWSANLVEVHCNQRGRTGITAIQSNLQEERGTTKVNSKRIKEQKRFKIMKTSENKALKGWSLNELK